MNIIYISLFFCLFIFVKNSSKNDLISHQIHEKREHFMMMKDMFAEMIYKSVIMNPFITEIRSVIDFINIASNHRDSLIKNPDERLKKDYLSFKIPKLYYIQINILLRNVTFSFENFILSLKKMKDSTEEQIDTILKNDFLDLRHDELNRIKNVLNSIIVNFSSDFIKHSQKVLLGDDLSCMTVSIKFLKLKELYENLIFFAEGCHYFKTCINIILIETYRKKEHDFSELVTLFNYEGKINSQHETKYNNYKNLFDKFVKNSYNISINNFCSEVINLNDHVFMIIEYLKYKNINIDTKVTDVYYYLKFIHILSFKISQTYKNIFSDKGFKIVFSYGEEQKNDFKEFSTRSKIIDDPDIYLLLAEKLVKTRDFKEFNLVKDELLRYYIHFYHSLQAGTYFLFKRLEDKFKESSDETSKIYQIKTKEDILKIGIIQINANNLCEILKRFVGYCSNNLEFTKIERGEAIPMIENYERLIREKTVSIIELASEYEIYDLKPRQKIKSEMNLRKSKKSRFYYLVNKHKELTETLENYSQLPTGIFKDTCTVEINKYCNFIDNIYSYYFKKKPKPKILRKFISFESGLNDFTKKENRDYLKEDIFTSGKEYIHENMKSEEDVDAYKLFKITSFS